MHRIGKLLWMILIFGIVFFIICDEKWYNIEFKDNQIIFDKTEKKSDSVIDEELLKNAVYKNSDLIHLNYEFENPKALRKSNGMDPEYLAKLEQEKREKKLEEEKIRKQEKVYTWPNIIALKNEDSISSVFQWIEKPQNTWTNKQEVKKNSWTTNQEIKQNTGTEKPRVKQNTRITKPEVKQNTWAIKQEVKQNTWTTKAETTWKVENSATKTWATEKVEPQKTVVYYPVSKYEHNKLTLNLNKWVKIPTVKIEKYIWKGSLSLNLYNGKNPEPKILYKNSNKIKIYSGFENPRNMRSSAGIDEDFLVKQENKKPTVISLNDNDTISSAWQNNPQNIDNIQDTMDDFELWNGEKALNTIEPEETTKEETTYKVDKYEHTNHSLDIKKSSEIQSIAPANEIQENYITIDRPEFSRHSINVSEWKLPEVVLVKIEKFQPNKHIISLKKWKIIKHDFVVENTENVESTGDVLSDPMLESLLENEEIDINTLESENDEFLQKVFQQTKDRDVMNLIVETYLTEYQFVKAKKFIEELPDEYRNQLKPSLNLRVAFNSFSLSSKTITENLNSIVQAYSSKNELSTEDQNRYLWVIALMDRNYDKFFEISAWFTSEKYKAFASKLQWYKDQIAKQMWMPEYYFDTLVALELFNQWLFQPAKVLALYSLQQNPNYILPHQVLAYANFLTNSWDTSVEYLKKLVDLDPNNAEKYRFLMWVACYRDEKYEQSVVMLSMIKDEKLRLDTQRYLINDYLKLDQKNKLISSWNKLLWSENLVASDFYTYFYETFFHPYSNWEEFELYAFDTELANKMLRVCSITLQNEEKAVCTYWTIGRNIAMWQFDGLEQYLLDLVAEYPQWYLYQALWDYYIQQWDLEKAKVYLIKAISLTQNKSERSQIKKLLQDTM